MWFDDQFCVIKSTDCNFRDTKFRIATSFYPNKTSGLILIHCENHTRAVWGDEGYLPFIFIFYQTFGKESSNYTRLTQHSIYFKNDCRY